MVNTKTPTFVPVLVKAGETFCFTFYSLRIHDYETIATYGPLQYHC